jgi:hypothetical protein
MPTARPDVLTGLLYLINILQPVSGFDLEREFKGLSKPLRQTSEPNATCQSLLDRLEKYDLIMKIKGRYSVTREGLRHISTAGLSRSRDKNRLFILKDLL